MGGNTLEVVQSVGGVETIFLVLSRYSTEDNFDWLGASSPLPISEPTEMTLVFYAFCGGNAEDAIAIDDIIFKPCEDCTTAISSTSTTETTTDFTDSTSTDPVSSTTTTPVITTVFTPPTVPCIGPLCPTTTSTETTAPSTTSNNAGTTVFNPPTAPCVGCLKIDPLSARSFLNNNFESGSAYPWYDNSSNSLHWVVEDFSSPTENYPPPTPKTGAKYLRATRDAQATPGQLILRTVTFTAFPGDKFSFNFWIRSKYTGGNYLELVLSYGGVETSLAELSGYSTSVNLEWRPMTVPIPISEPADVTFTFFAFCGGNTEDAIAIDDIVVGSSGTKPSTSVTTPTTTTTTTTTTTRPAPLQVTTTFFTPPTVPCIGPLCPTTTPTTTPAPSQVTTTVFTPSTVPCFGCPTTTPTTTPAPSQVTTTFFTPPTVPCIGPLCPTTTPTTTPAPSQVTTTVFTPSTVPCFGCPTTTPTTTPAPSQVTTTFFTPPTVPCIGPLCPTTTPTTTPAPSQFTTTVFTPPTVPCVGCSTPTPTTKPAPGICGGTYNSASGTVTSPNYPSPYGFDEDCRYKISIPSGNGIKLTFTYFNTENGYDFVMVYDGPTAASAVLLRTSGYNVNLSVTTSTRDCLIMHTSDWKNKLVGWTATYESV
ncbi:mucin-2-like [Daphnia pulicaria]|uniref:mucin-2-like n=1 Tax=Daphnia pulicaria TaxID=35523 RepID=UPI001EE9CC94|nr:mucin-2-like [Daphnia pulicaria]